MSIGRDAAPAYSEELRSSNIARTTSTYDVDRLGEFTLSYKKKIGRHHIDALAGYTLQKKTYDRLGVEATASPTTASTRLRATGSNASDISLYSTRKAAWAMMSFLTRVNYSFDDRYTLTGLVPRRRFLAFRHRQPLGLTSPRSRRLDALERTLPQGCAQGRGFDPSARQLG